MLRKRLSYTIWTVIILTLAGAIYLAGENPLHVLKIVAMSSFGSAENFSGTLFYATPLIFTGGGVWLALECGLFNIGAEGQLNMGALFGMAWGVYLTKHSLPVWAGLVGGVLCAALGGGLWGAIAGYLRAYRKNHEVIVTIMLNFIATAFANWWILYVYKNPETQNLETVWIPESMRLHKFWLQMPSSFFLSLFVLALTVFIVRKTWFGFYIRATGLNSVAAKVAGVSVEKIIFITMLGSGAMAGLVGFHEIYCNSYRFIDGFSPGYGFTGLAVALLARGRLPFLKILAAALFLAALHKGSLDLDLETEKITRDFSLVIQALLLVGVAESVKSREE